MIFNGSWWGVNEKRRHQNDAFLLKELSGGIVAAGNL
jgi:hypothetical protein